MQNISEAAPSGNGTIPSGVDWALYAAGCGLPVFPLLPGRGIPYETGAMNAALGLPADAPAGCRHATTDPERIKVMWAGDRAGARIGIATGDGLLAVDLDEKNGKSGSATMAANGWQVTETATQRTKSGGWHYLLDVPNGTHAPTDSDVLGSGIDRRGDGGYVALYDPGLLTTKRAPAPAWALTPGKGPGERMAAEDVVRAERYDVALSALNSRESDEMERGEWLLFSGAFHTATAGLVDDTQALSDWQAWNVQRGETNDPPANARAWENFKRGGTGGDFRTLASMAAPAHPAKAHAAFGNGPPPLPAGASATRLPRAANDDQRRAISAANLFEHVLAGDDEPLRWHIDGLIPEDGLIPIHGPPKQGKTFVAIDMGTCVATGEPFHGRKVAQGTVFYICGEGFRAIKQRFAAWSEARGVSLEGAPLFRSQCAVPLLDAESAAMLSDAVAGLAAAHGSPRLIIVDTLARNFGDGDENSTSDMTRFIAAIDQLKAQWSGCSVIVVHHSGLADTKRARGSSALLGAADAEFRVESNATGPALFCTAMKDAAPGPAMQFELVEAGRSVALEYTGEPSGKGAGKPITPTEQMAFDAWRAVAVDGCANLEAWRAAFYERHTSDKPDTRLKAFNRGREGLVERTMLESDDDGEIYSVPAMPGQMPDR